MGRFDKVPSVATKVCACCGRKSINGDELDNFTLTGAHAVPLTMPLPGRKGKVWGDLETLADGSIRLHEHSCAEFIAAMVETFNENENAEVDILGAMAALRLHVLDLLKAGVLENAISIGGGTPPTTVSVMTECAKRLATEKGEAMLFAAFCAFRGKHMGTPHKRVSSDRFEEALSKAMDDERNKRRFRTWMEALAADITQKHGGLRFAMTIALKFTGVSNRNLQLIEQFRACAGSATWRRWANKRTKDHWATIFVDCARAIREGCGGYGNYDNWYRQYVKRAVTVGSGSFAGTCYTSVAFRGPLAPAGTFDFAFPKEAKGRKRRMIVQLFREEVITQSEKVELMDLAAVSEKKFNTGHWFNVKSRDETAIPPYASQIYEENPDMVHRGARVFKQMEEEKAAAEKATEALLEGAVDATEMEDAHGVDEDEAILEAAANQTTEQLLSAQRRLDALAQESDAIASASLGSMTNLKMIDLLVTPPSGPAGNLAAIKYYEEGFAELLRTHHLPILVDIDCFRAFLHLRQSICARDSRQSGIGHWCNIHPGFVAFIDHFHVVLEGFRVVYKVFHGFFIEDCFKEVIGSDYSFAAVKCKVSMTMFGVLNEAYPRVREKLRRKLVEAAAANDDAVDAYQLLYFLLETAIPVIREFTWAYETNNWDMLIPAMADVASLFMMLGAHNYSKALVHQLAIYERLRASRHPLFLVIKKMQGYFTQRPLEQFHRFLSTSMENAPVENDYDQCKLRTVLYNPFRKEVANLEREILSESQRKRKKLSYEAKNHGELVDGMEAYLHKFIDTMIPQGVFFRFKKAGNKANVAHLALKAKPAAWIRMDMLSSTKITERWTATIATVCELYKGGTYNSEKANKKLHTMLKSCYDREKRCTSYERLKEAVGKNNIVRFDRRTKQQKRKRAARDAAEAAAAEAAPVPNKRPKRASAADAVAAAAVAAGARARGSKPSKPKAPKPLNTKKFVLVLEIPESRCSPAVVAATSSLYNKVEWPQAKFANARVE